MSKSKINDPRPAGKRAKDKEANKSRTKALKRKNQLKSAETKQEKKVIHKVQQRQVKKAKKQRSYDAKDKAITLKMKKARGKKKSP
jgi:hypothetical protein